MDNAVSQVEKGRAVLDSGILTSCWKGHDAGKYLEEENILNLEEKKNGVGLGGNYLENEKALAAEEKKNRGGKEGNYLEKEK